MVGVGVRSKGKRRASPSPHVGTAQMGAAESESRPRFVSITRDITIVYDQELGVLFSVGLFGLACTLTGL